MSESFLEAIRQHPEFLEEVLSASVAAITVIGPDGQIAYANRSAQRILGLEPSDITERTFDDPAWSITAIDGGPFPEEQLPFRRVLDTGEPVEDVRHAIVWPDGRRRYLSINAAPLALTGMPTLVVAGVHDITDQIHAEERLRRSNAELERLAWVSAHHLMEPTRRLLSFSDHLRRLLGPGRGGEVETVLGYLDQDAQRLQRLVRDIQVHLSAAEPRGEMACRDPGELIAELRPELARAYPERYTPEALRVGELPPACIDAPRFRDLWWALLDNAFRHAGADRAPRVEVRGESRGRWVRYRVADNGPGVPAAFRERLFEVFERLESGDSGTGIGLPLARRIVESMGGRIGLEEGVEGGLVVVFELPVAVDEPGGCG